MIKRLFFLFTTFCAAQSYGQVWTYDFGSIADSITSGSATSPTFLPVTSDGGNVYSRVGTGGGNVTTRNFSGFGTGSALRLQAPTGTSVNKISFYGLPSATKTLGLRFTASFGDPTNGTPSSPSGKFYLIAGSGSSYPGASGFSGTQTFLGIQWNFTSTGVTMDGRNGSSWSGLSSPTVSYATSTDFTIYMNNDLTSVTYTGVDNVSRSLASNTWDLYMNGIYVANYNKAQMANDSTINSLMFYGVSASGNVASMFIDNIVYTKNIASNPLPLRLNFFDAIPDNNSVRLFWKTEVEDGIKSYLVERSLNGSTFSQIGAINSLKTNGSSYTYTDVQPAATNYYRLKMMKEDGSFEYSQIITAKVGAPTAGIKIWYNENNIHFDKHNQPIVVVYDITGKRILHTQLSNSEYILNVSLLNPGVYYVRVQDGKETTYLKFVK